MMRFVMNIHLTWLKIEVALIALLVPGLIVESSVANGWVYAGGTFANGWFPVAIGLLRGFFFETLTYATARQAFLLFHKRNWFGCVLMAVVCLAAIFVSAVNNLGWVMAGHDLAGLFSTLGAIVGKGWLYRGYEFFLAVLLPLSVGAIALVPLDHFFQHALEQDHLDNHALQVDERHMHRTAYLKAQRKQAKVIQSEYEGIAADRATLFVKRVRAGDLSFGAGQGVPQVEASAQPVIDSTLVQQLPSQGGTSIWPANP